MSFMSKALNDFLDRLLTDPTFHSLALEHPEQALSQSNLSQKEKEAVQNYLKKVGTTDNMVISPNAATWV